LKANPNESLVDTLLLTGLVGMILLQFLPQLRPEPPTLPVTPPGPSVAEVRRIEERGMVLDASADFSRDTQGAIDPDGRATNPRTVLEDARVALVPPHAVPELKMVWAAVAVSLQQDRLATEALGELARVPENLKAHGPRLDTLTRLAQGQAAKDLPTLVAWFKSLGATDWLGERLKARQAANAGDVMGAEAAVSAARDIARRFVNAHLTVIGLQLGLMLLGLITLVVFPLFVRQRLASRGMRGLHGLTSPFRLDRSRRVLIGWWLFTWIAQFFLARTLAGIGAEGTAKAALQLVATLVNGAIAVAVIVYWGRTEADGGLWAALRLRRQDAPLGLGGLALWFLPAAGFAVVAAQMAAYMSSLVFQQPEQFQQTVQLLMASDDTLSLLLIGLGAIVFAPLGEEILFRGFLYRNFRDSMSRPLAIVLSGVIFGLVHMHPGYFIPLTGIGIALALLYEWTGSLWVPVLAHAAFNAVTLVQVHVTYHF